MRSPYINTLLQKDHVDAFELGPEGWVHKNCVQLALHHLIWSAHILFPVGHNSWCRGGGEIGKNKVHLDLKLLAVLLCNGNCVRVNVKPYVVSICRA